MIHHFKLSKCVFIMKHVIISNMQFPDQSEASTSLNSEYFIFKIKIKILVVNFFFLFFFLID